MKHASIFVIHFIRLWNNVPNLQRGLCYIRSHVNHSPCLPHAGSTPSKKKKASTIWRVLIPATSTFSSIFIFDWPFSAEAGVLLIGCIVFVGGTTVDVLGATPPFYYWYITTLAPPSRFRKPGICVRRASQTIIFIFEILIVCLFYIPNWNRRRAVV